MIKFAQLTIYEGFGYLLPGAVLVSAIAIIAWTAWAPDQPLPIFAPSFDLWAVFIVVAYYAGHAVQGAGNIILDYDSPIHVSLRMSRRWNKLATWFGKLFGPPSRAYRGILEPLAAKKAKKLLNSSANLGFVLLDRLADEALVQRGVSSQIEVYVYSEGFYRGSCVSLLIFALSVWFRAWRGHTLVSFWGRDHVMYRAELVWLGILCFTAALIFLRRFIRFGQLHHRASILGFLMLDEGRPKEPTVSDD